MGEKIRYRITESFLKKLNEYIEKYCSATELGVNIKAGRAYIGRLQKGEIGTIRYEKLEKIAHGFAEKHMEYVKKNNELVGKDISDKSNKEDMLEVEKNILQSMISALKPRAGENTDLSHAETDAEYTIEKNQELTYNAASEIRQNKSTEHAYEFKEGISEKREVPPKDRSRSELEKYYANLLLEYNCAYPRTFKNSEWINRMISHISKMGYTASEFIEEIVNKKEEFVIINFDRSLLKFRAEFQKNYLENLLTDEKSKCHQRTTFMEMSAIVYCFFELLYEKDQKGFWDLMQEEARQDVFFTRIFDSDKALEEKLRKITCGILFMLEYPDSDDTLKHCSNSEGAKEEIDCLFPLWNAEKDRMKWKEIYAFEWYMELLGEYADEDENDKEFYSTMKNSLLHQKNALMYAIYGKDYTKIKGDYNCDMFIKEFNDLFEKWSNQEEGHYKCFESPGKIRTLRVLDDYGVGAALYSAERETDIALKKENTALGSEREKWLGDSRKHSLEEHLRGGARGKVEKSMKISVNKYLD